MSDKAPTIEAEEALILEDFAFLEGAREKIEHIVELGKHLPSLEDAAKTEGNRVRGCQSQVWMVAGLDPSSGHMRLRADSDAVIVKGLISLVLQLYDDRPPQAVAASSEAVFERLGLGAMLTPGRQNGLYAMLARMRQLAAALATAGSA